MQDFEDYIMFFVNCFVILYLTHLFWRAFISVIDLILSKDKELIPEIIVRILLSFAILFTLTVDKYYLLSVGIMVLLIKLAVLFFEDWKLFSKVISKKKSNEVDQKPGSNANLIPTITISPIKDIRITNTNIKSLKNAIDNNNRIMITNPYGTLTDKDIHKIIPSILKLLKYDIKTFDLTDAQQFNAFNPYDIPYESILKKVYAFIAEHNNEALNTIRLVVNDLFLLSKVQKKYILNKINSELDTESIKKSKRRKNERY